MIRKRHLTRCHGKRWLHTGLLRYTCMEHGVRDRVVGMWLHVGSTLFLFGQRAVLEDMP